MGSDAEERGDGIQGEMAGDARAAAEQQLVAFEGRGAVEVGVAGTGLTEQVLGNEAAQIHRLLILTEPLHQLFAAHTDDAGGHHRLDRGQCGATVEAGGIVARKLALEREPCDVLLVVADAVCHVLEAPLGDEAEPPCGVALALQLVALAVLHHLALALAKLAQHLDVNAIFPEFLFHRQ